MPEYQNQALVTGEQAGSEDRYAMDVPVYQHIADLSQLRADHPALVDGAQIERLATDSVYAFSRVDRSEKVEYLVAFNNSATPQAVSVTTLTAGATFAPLYGADASVASDGAAAASITVPALSAVVLKADRPVSAPAEAAAITVDVPAAGAAVTGSAAVSADADDSWRETSFAWRVVGSDDWHALGTAEDTTPGVFHDVHDLANGTLVEYRAVSTDAAGNRSADSTYASVGNKVNLGVEPEEPEGPAEPEPQEGPNPPYDFVSVPGNFNSEVGCSEDWQPELRQDPDDQAGG